MKHEGENKKIERFNRCKICTQDSLVILYYTVYPNKFFYYAKNLKKIWDGKKNININANRTKLSKWSSLRSSVGIREKCHQQVQWKLVPLSKKSGGVDIGCDGWMMDEDDDGWGWWWWRSRRRTKLQHQGVTTFDFAVQSFYVVESMP